MQNVFVCQVLHRGDHKSRSRQLPCWRWHGIVIHDCDNNFEFDSIGTQADNASETSFEITRHPDTQQPIDIVSAEAALKRQQLSFDNICLKDNIAHIYSKAKSFDQQCFEPQSKSAKCIHTYTHSHPYNTF